MMGIAMKSFVLLLCGILAGFAPSRAAELARVESVYLLPMSGGLDQFLANRLTGGHVLQVVADPKKADAIFTDRLGAAFESRLDEIHPPPEPPKPEKAAGTEESQKSETGAAEERRVRASTFGGGKGTVFLVDSKTRAILWSTFEKPKSSASDQLDRTAERIVERLRRDLKGK